MKEKKVLIADYDQRSLDSLVKMFKPYDIQILTARDGETAFDIVQKENPDLVICEAMLPKIHGFDLTKKINMNNKNPVPVIIITNVYKGSHYRDEAIRFFGAYGYFEKPINEKELLNAVVNLLFDETDIKEELPDPESVIDILHQMLEEKPSIDRGKD